VARAGPGAGLEATPLALVLALAVTAAADEGFTLRSPAFAPGAAIPRQYTCEGEDVSPPLRWSAPPEGTRSLVLIVHDPDVPDPAAPRRRWIHWVIAGLPPAAGELPADVAETALPAGARSGRNDWGRTGYGGPCPPIGRHRYIHRLYALDVALQGPAEPSAEALEKAMQGHVLALAELLGTYQKASR
jgi:Raf kinase inhibitor-like YbhB/YbcL family protein